MLVNLESAFARLNMLTGVNFPPQKDKIFIQVHSCPTSPRFYGCAHAYGDGHTMTGWCKLLFTSLKAFLLLSISAVFQKVS